MASKASARVTIDQQPYYITQTNTTLSVRLLEQLRTYDTKFVLCTAIRWTDRVFNDENLKATCYQFSATDDVWTSAFESLIILLSPTKTDVDINKHRIVQVDNSKAHLPQGPLLVEKSTGHIFKVAKLVKDTHFAFISAIVPGHKRRGAFLALSQDVKQGLQLGHPSVAEEIASEDELELALPSRLYFEKTDARPLAGVRVAVKDTIALKGLRTGYGNSAWFETYAPEKLTAPCVQRLLDAGAVIIGKTKTSEFAEGIDPTDWKEGVCPFNPRGDGQQKPSSSSTGSASAVAAYDWLDVAYGTDTGGSIRHPAGVQGLYGQRPTHGSLDMTGVLGATPLLNTVGLFARETEMFTKVGSYLIDPKNRLKVNPQHRKYNLLYPVRASDANNRDPFHGNQLRWFPHEEISKASYSEAEKEHEVFVSRMEAELHCKRVPFNVDELWRATHPIGQSRSIDEATGFIYGVITTATACKIDIDQFIQDYVAANNGKRPAISDLVSRRFDYGRQCSGETFAAALKATEAFSRWVLNDLFGSLDQDATTLLVFPQSWGRPDYRDGPEQAVLFKEAFSIYSFAYLCGCPDYTIPIAEIPHHSPITNRTEYLPVSISLLGRPGTDLELFGVVDYLYEKKAIADVMAGSRLYAGHSIGTPFSPQGHTTQTTGF